MANDFLSSVLARWHLTGDDSERRLESRSGAGVHRVRTADGRTAYLKVTPSTLDTPAVQAARRELRFYRELAPVVPARTPTLLDVLDDEQGVALLLEAAGATQPPGAWSASLWAELGQALARLHDLPAPAGWERPDALAEVMANPDIDALRTFWSSSLPQFAELLARRDTLWAQLSAVPPAFIHGDCHTENLPVRAGHPVFCDWQVTGIGRPTTDLAFLSVRAVPHGATVPAALLEAYLDARSGDADAIRRAVRVEELAYFVFLWPPYAVFNDAGAIERVRRRTRHLAERWLAEAADGAR
jgi:Ser/Thr protein kinase RdoA (MazF antagonist)